MEKEKYGFVKKWWFWLIVAIFILVVLSSTNGSKDTAESNTTSTNAAVNQTSEEKMVFLKGSNGKEFYEILCDVSNVEKKQGIKFGEVIDYASSNTKYGIELETNDNNEINWISIYTLSNNKNDYENFFIAISRLEYNGSNQSECSNWIHENLGKEATTKIGDANFKLYNGTSGNPILEVYTDGNEEFQQQLLDNMTKDK